MVTLKESGRFDEKMGKIFEEIRVSYIFSSCLFILSPKDKKSHLSCLVDFIIFVARLKYIAYNFYNFSIKNHPILLFQRLSSLTFTFNYDTLAVLRKRLQVSPEDKSASV